MNLHFDECGLVVAVTATEPPEDPAAELLERLRDLGVRIPAGVESQALTAIDAAFDQHGDARAAEALHLIRSRLEGTAGGLALERAMFGDSGGVSLRKAAAGAKVSPSAIWKNLQTIRRRLSRGVHAPHR